MHLVSLTVKGYRGFADGQTLQFAKPTGANGSGLTVLVGPNNGGKSSVLEALSAIFSQNSVSFTEGKRNKLAGDRVSISITFSSGETHELRTIERGGSTTVRQADSRPPNICYVLPSRRSFSPYFGQGEQGRESYTGSIGLPQTRSQSLDDFSSRLHYVIGSEDNLAKFDGVLRRVANNVPAWTIDQDEQGSYYLKFDNSGQSHTSDGLGEGLVSLIFLIDALYDSQPGDVIVIDEPELSLHPIYQRKLASLLAEYAEDRQIVYATHSTYFVNFEHILNGAGVGRVHKVSGCCKISQLKRETAQQLSGMLTNRNNPHILGLNAREVFFQEDGVVVLEGQEDVVYYPQILEQLPDQFDLSDRFYGWGAGGAGNVVKIVALLRDLGFSRIAAILDHDKRCLIPGLRDEFPDYFFDSIPANDVRTKPARPSQEEVEGLLDAGILRSEFTEKTTTLFGKIDEYINQCGNV